MSAKYTGTPLLVASVPEVAPDIAAPTIANTT